MDKILSLLEKISPLFAHYPKWGQWLFIVTFAAFLGSVFVFGIGFASAKQSLAGMTADGTLPSLVMLARTPPRNASPARYVIESATMLVRITSRKNAGGWIQTAEADTRFIYTVFALEDIVAGEFDDYAHTNVQGAAVAWLAGSEPESVNEPGPNVKAWTLGSPIPKGKRRTFVTGVRYIYPDFADLRQVHDFEKLPPHEDAFCYPNKSDVIGELSIVIESDVPLLEPSDKDAFLKDRLKNVSISAEALAYRHSNSEGVLHHELVARWSTVTPQANAELHFTRATSHTQSPPTPSNAASATPAP
ncbi:MAG: hypothetical protein WDO74_35550 [Pseudomonadota bacterium]